MYATFISDLMWYLGATCFMGFCLWMLVLPTRRQRLGWTYSEGAHRANGSRHQQGKIELFSVLFLVSLIIWAISAWILVQHVGSF